MNYQVTHRQGQRLRGCQRLRCSTRRRWSARPCSQRSWSPARARGAERSCQCPLGHRQVTKSTLSTKQDGPHLALEVTARVGVSGNGLADGRVAHQCDVPGSLSWSRLLLLLLLHGHHHHGHRHHGHGLRIPHNGADDAGRHGLGAPGVANDGHRSVDRAIIHGIATICLRHFLEVSLRLCFFASLRDINRGCTPSSVEVKTCKKLS
jgi:hypothetical protein